MSEEMHQKLAQAVIDSEPEEAEALAEEALKQGLDPLACITNGLTKGSQEVGKLFASDEYFLPELIIGASALLTTTMLQQKKLIMAIEEAGLRNKVKVMVGGAPVTDNFAKEIGADGYAEDAISAVELAVIAAPTIR